MSMSPVVTVIIASMNSVGTIQRCIDSFAGQTYNFKELIIVDSASTDGTLSVLQKNNHIINFWVSEKDRGIAHAWNKALKKAAGEWILFLGADDVLASSTILEDYTRKISEHSFGNGRIIYGEVRVLFPGSEGPSLKGGDWESVRAVFFSEKMMIPHQACFHHSSVFEEYGSFDEQYKIVADYEFLLRVLKKEDALFAKGLIVTDMAFGGISSRVASLLAMQKECDEALLKNGFRPRGYKRRCNVIVYNILGLLTKFGGEKNAAKFLDVMRILLGKKPIWNYK